MAFTDSIKWNGKSLRDYLAEITEVKGRGKPRVRVKGISIPGRHGQMAFKQTYKPRIIEIEGTVEGTSHANLMSNIDNLKSLFAMEDELLPTGNRTIFDGMEYGKLEFGDESDRYYNAVFDGLFDLPEISHRWMSNDIKRFRARFRCDEPFAVAGVLSEATMAGSADEFKTFSTGTAHNDSIIEIEGAATNPMLVEGDKAGVAHFNYNDNLSDVTLAEVTGNFTSLFGQRTFKSLTSQQSKGIQIVQKDNLYYNRGNLVNGFNYTNFNPYQGTIILWIRPNWDGDDNKIHRIFYEKESVNNYIVIFKRNSNSIRFEVVSGGTTRNCAIVVNSSNFAKGEWHFVAARWDTNNPIDSSANQIQLDIVTQEAGDTGSLPAPTGIDTTISIGQLETNDGTDVVDGLIRYQLFERALSDSELSDLYNSGSGVEPFVTPDTRLLSAGESDGSDLPVSIQYPMVDNKITGGNQEIDPADLSEWIHGGAGGSSIDASVTNESVIVKYDTQSAQLDFNSAASGSYAYRPTVALVDNGNYFYRFWIRAGSLHASDELHLDIVGNSTVHSRRLDNGSDDLGVSLATGKWLYFEATFEADGAVAHDLRFRKVNANGNATLYFDQMDVQVNKINKPDFEGTYSAGLAPGWTKESTATVTEVNSNTHSGSSSQQITASAGQAGITQSMNIGANKWLLLTIWARTNSGTGTLILQHDLTSNNAADRSRTFTNEVTTTWKKFSLLVRTVSGETRDIRIRAVNGEGTIVVDDVAYIELDTLSANASSAATPEFDSYSQERFGQGLQLDGGDTLSWNITANKDEGSIIAWLKPLFGSDWTDKTQDAVFCEIQYDSSNSLRLFYDSTNGKFVFRKKVSGTDYYAELLAPTFNAGETLCLAGTYGAGGVKVYLNGIAGNVTNSNVSALSGNPSILYMSDAAQTLFPDAIVDELYLFSRELSGVEALKYANSAIALKNDNAKFSMTKVLAEGDRLLLDSKKQTVEFADSSAGTFTNAVASMDVGAIVPKLESGKSVIFNKTANGGMNIKYRKRWL